MLAGLQELTGGEIHIAGMDVSALAPKDRGIAMVFQNYALYPHLTVADNIGFPMKLAGIPAEERDRRIREAAELLGLSGVLGRKPEDLGTGDRQRVALARSIVRSPTVLLMDEPLANLDAKLRAETREMVAALHAQLRITTLYATADAGEATAFGQRVAVLAEGVLQQVDFPDALRDRPANEVVREFLAARVGGQPS
jgi:multiple sugar transport system ATP-binding protein